MHDGTVLPILHLNGYKIANPTVPARIPERELLAQLEGHGHRPYVLDGGFDGEDPMAVHLRMAQVLDKITAEIARIRARAAEQLAAGCDVERPAWPALVIRTPKGWTGPREVDGAQVEGTLRAHQEPLTEVRTDEEHRRHDHCLRTRDHVNVVVAGKNPAPQWLTMDEAVAHCARGIGVWDWAGSDAGEEPDVVLGCAGDVPTLEALAAVSLLRRHLPE